MLAQVVPSVVMAIKSFKMDASSDNRDIELPSIPPAIMAIQSLIMDESPGNYISCYSNPEFNNGQ